MLPCSLILNYEHVPPATADQPLRVAPATVAAGAVEAVLTEIGRL
jgi:hypothetical protein